MFKVGIVGFGFSGTLTAVHLIEKWQQPFELIVIDNNGAAKGIAYNAYSNKHILNVIAGKMSAYTHNPNHFVEWVMQQDAYRQLDETIIANAFLPRNLYGTYLDHIWESAKTLAAKKGILIDVIKEKVNDLKIGASTTEIVLANSQIMVDACIIATGNQLPRNPVIKNMDFYKSGNYFQNPWQQASVANLSNQPVLIIGNGLTMVDTVLAIQEQGYNGVIYTLSPNGFNILPHRHNGLKYTKLAEEIKDDHSLNELATLVIKHIKQVRQFGISAEPVIDSLRPFTQKIWQRFSETERQIFMSRWRHLWGLARHRIPMHSHDTLQKLKLNNKLIIISGNVKSITELEHCIIVDYIDKKTKTTKSIEVSRIINCTGPETDILKIENSFLKNAVVQQHITQDPLKLGINSNTDTFEVINYKGQPVGHVYTLGSNLKGMLWESTAVNELRTQAENLAQTIVRKHIRQSSVVTY